MLWKSLNFWRIATFVLFIAVLALAFPNLKSGPEFVLEDSGMQIVETPSHGALFSYKVRNEGTSGGDTFVNFHAYLYERGGDAEEDYKTIGVNGGETKTGEFFMPLRPNQSVHDWRVELT